MIELILIDIDGVMTDGTKIYDGTGVCVYKKFCDCDFTAIKRMKAAGVSVCFLSGDETINKAMANNRNIDFYFSRGKEKLEFLPMLCKKYGATPKKTLYIGDDIFDVELLKAVGYPFCPEDAIPEVRQVCDSLGTLSVKGGDKVISSLYAKLVRWGLVKNIGAEGIQSLDLEEIW